MPIPCHIIHPSIHPSNLPLHYPPASHQLPNLPLSLECTSRFISRRLPPSFSTSLSIPRFPFANSRNESADIDLRSSPPLLQPITAALGSEPPLLRWAHPPTHSLTPPPPYATPASACTKVTVANRRRHSRHLKDEVDIYSPQPRRQESSNRAFPSDCVVQQQSLRPFVSLCNIPLGISSETRLEGKERKKERKKEGRKERKENKIKNTHTYTYTDILHTHTHTHTHTHLHSRTHTQTQKKKKLAPFYRTFFFFSFLFLAARVF